MEKHKYLNIKGTNLEKEQLEKYLIQIAEEHVISKNSEKLTYPIEKLRTNYRNILKTYEMLNEHLKLGIKIHSAGEWLLDNFYIIEETIKNIEKNMNLKKYIKLPGLATGKYKGFARIYVLASEITAFSDDSISEENIINALKSYQTRKILSMEEIWNIGIFIQISIIQTIADICERIYYSQIQKYKVENIFERLIELRENKELRFRKKFKNNNSLKIKDVNYSFIEYMLYKLRRIGKKGNLYIEILEKQVNKLGFKTDEIVKKEHLYVATLKIKIGSCITSIKTINRINFQKVFEKTNKTEELLNEDPCGVFKNMTEDTKELYRDEIKKLSNKLKISEIYISEEILKLASRYKNSEELIDKRKSHVGYYLIDEGKYELKEKITEKRVRRPRKIKPTLYIMSIFILSAIIDFLITLNINQNTLINIIIFIVLYIPVYEIVIKIINYILSKVVKAQKLPKINFEDGIGKENKTMVIIPTIIDSEEKIKEIIQKIEVYHLANQDENLYFTILGDCTTSEKEVEKEDKKLILCGKKEIEKLNKKYNSDNKFNFMYRKRRWNPNEGKFLGWERKRGLLIQFNDVLITQNNTDFICNTLENFKEKIKYVITLDSDTNLILDSAQKLIGAMSHILNQPIIEDNAVKIGYGIMQPRIGIKLEDSQKTMFTKIFACNPGVDFYTNAISDIYQDCFKEGIFAGKGIYDLNIYQELIKDKLPENRILSHDLLEGNYLRCGLLTDVVLLDTFPTKYLSYLERENRWIRGDWQISGWLEDRVNNIKNPINKLSKFKIFDNLRRSILPISQAILIILSIWKNSVLLSIITLISIFITTILEVINKILFKKSISGEKIYAYKKFYKNISGIRGSLLRNALEFTFLPTNLMNSTIAIVKTLYRLRKSKNLLEWKTSDAVDKSMSNSLEYYCKRMSANIIFGIFMFGLLNPFAMIIGTIWILGPYIAWEISKNSKIEMKISEKNKKYLLDVAKQTWKYFEETCKPENNFLVPDNYQINRKNVFVNRTSSTNIGLELISIISAYDLNFINLEQAIHAIENILEIISKLEKWNGHLYNWYNIKTLKPLTPRYVSTVDSGNFIGYLYILKSFLISKNLENGIVKKVDKLIDNTDFSTLYNYKNRLFSIGFDIENDKLSDSYYDFLASEARQTSFVAIAKKDIKYKHWINLSRTLTATDGYKGLISWSGTAFEYLMPNLIMKVPQGSLIDESCRFAKISQIDYARKNNIPWGISESAYSLKDLQSNYQYKAFGIPTLGLKRGLEEELVVSPYSTFLFLEYGIEEGIRNLKEIEKFDMRGKYGFYDSLDFTKERLDSENKEQPVKTFMAHHQGLILNSINNVLNNNILAKRFMKNPEIKAIEILLNERMPETVVLSKERTNKTIKGKYINKFEDKEICYEKQNNYRRINVISSDNYTNVIDTTGRGYSKYKNIQINRFKNRNDEKEGIGFFIKNIRNQKIWSTFESNEIKFTQYKEEFIQKQENIETTMKVFLLSNGEAEIRELTIKNNGILPESLEIYSFLEPILSDVRDDIAHPIYNNMFLKFEYIEEKQILIVSRKIKDKEIYLGMKLLTQEGTETEIEIEKEKFWGRNQKNPISVTKSNNFSNEIKEVVEPIVAIKTKIEIQPKEKNKIDLLMYVSEEKEQLISEIENMNVEKASKELELSKAKSEEEIKFLEINGNRIENNQRILGHCLEKDLPKNINIDYKIEDVWKFGISGDNPIILVEIKNTEEIHLIDELLETIEFFNVKNIKIDLCILNNEKMSYETFVKDEINESIKNRRLEYLRNNQIFVFNKTELTKHDIEIIKAISCINFYGDIGDVKSNLEEMEDSNKEIINKEYEENSKNDDVEKEELIFDNSYGGFKDKEYLITVENGKLPPRAWSNIISNGKIGTVITENSGGYTWFNNCRLFRITTWENDAIQDFPTETILLKDIDEKQYWKLGSDANKNSYHVTYGQGYTKFTQINNDLIQENKIFIPIDGESKINHITIKNKLPNKRRIMLYYVINLCMSETKEKGLGKIRTTKENNFIILENICKTEFPDKIKITSDTPIKSYTNNKNEFFDNEMNPIGINKKELENAGNISQGNELILQIPVDLEEYEKKKINIIFGKDAEKYLENNIIEEEIENVDRYWNEKTGNIKVRTPSEKINIYMNKWLVYQTITSRINAKTGFYQSGGALGFRDQLQDSIGMKWVDEAILEKQIIEAAKHQFIEGDVMHWWHKENKTGIRTKISDDLLWLPYSVLEYIEFTEDWNILEKEVQYSKGILLDGEKERYDKFEYTKDKESIFKHCMRAINKSLDFGENGLPKIGTGDWNDGFNLIGHKEKGESIWLGFFLYDILNRWEKVLEYKKDNQTKEKFTRIKKDLKKVLNKTGWDGAWYKRAITDDGKVIGSSGNKECKIDSLAQSWAIISEAGDNDKKYIALESAKKYLIDEENQIIKLLTPPFKDGEINPGYIKKYPAGVRENGGQYTHAAIWLIMAFAKIGMIDEAIKYAEMINPITHAETMEKSMRYKIEPYVLPGDIYSNQYMVGRGGWSWYTGSSSWYYKVCLEDILGIKRKGKKLFLPEIPSKTWENYEIQYKYKTNLYNIKINNGHENDEIEVLINGKKTEKNYIELQDENKIINIEIKM